MVDESNLRSGQKHSPGGHHLDMQNPGDLQYMWSKDGARGMRKSQQPA